MMTREAVLLEQRRPGGAQGHCTVARLCALHLVTVHELRELDEALSRGCVPMDFERKLCRLDGGSLLDRYVAQNCRLLISWLQASRQGLSKDLSRAECDRVLRVLAYVRKDEDAIPDYRSDGFRDDAQEIRALEAELAPALQRFKHWRLRHQVPGMWLSSPS